MKIKVARDWDQMLKPELQKEYMKDLQSYLKKEYNSEKIYPKNKYIFRSLELPHSAVKVVILAQDPYHGPGQANGLAFAVNQGIKAPPSLKNIIKEVHRDTGLTLEDETLGDLSQQGVLLLNTVLTVREGQPGSHRNRGWEKFTDRIIKLLNQREKPLVFMLWGKYAWSKIPLISNENHLVLTSTHPSPLSAHRGFLGCSHFSKANNFLKQSKQKPIAWGVK